MRVYDLASMSCSYVLTGHSDIVLCLDTCISSSGRTLIVTGSKDTTVSLLLIKCFYQFSVWMSKLNYYVVTYLHVLLSDPIFSTGQVVGTRKQMLHRNWHWPCGGSGGCCILEEKPQLFCQW